MPPRRNKNKDKGNDTTTDNVVQDQLQTTANITTPYPILLFFLFPSPTSAQDDPPTPVYQAQFTTYSNKTLYIRGGLDQDRAPVAQLYSLDLTPLFTNSTILSWKKLNHFSPFTDFETQLPLGVHQDNNGLTYFGLDGTQSTYNSTTNTWTAELPTCKPIVDNLRLTIPSSLGGRVAVTDPTIEVIYVPHGYDSVNMMMYNVHSNGCGAVAMPESVVGKYFTWSVSRGAIYMLGTPVTPSNSSLWERQFDIGSWELIPSIDTPPLFTGSCVTSAFGGEKLIVFGGSSDSGQVNGNTYIFDTGPRKWSLGAVSLKPRSGMVCASAGDYFVAWGGYENATTLPSEMLFYNIRTNTWINQTVVPPSSGTDDTNNQETASKTDPAPIGGGAAAGVVVMMAFIVGLFILRRRRRRRRHRQDPTQRRHPQEMGHDLRSTPTSDKSESDAYLLSNIQSDPRHPNAPHKPLDPAVSFLYSRNPTICRNAAQELHYDPEEAFVATFETKNPQALPSEETREPASYPLPPSPLFSAPQHYHLSQQMDQLSWEQSLARPQCIVPPSPRSLDYARLAQEFPPPPPIARDPQKQANEGLLNPVERLALVQLKYEQDVERLRQEQLVELEMIRKQWEEQQQESAQS